MLTLEQIEGKYEELLKKWADEYGTQTDHEAMKMHYGKIGWIAALGWVLGKNEVAVGQDMDDYIQWVHRENPTVLAHWRRPA